MPDHVERLLVEYRTEGVPVDANLLLLLHHALANDQQAVINFNHLRPANW